MSPANDSNQRTEKKLKQSHGNYTVSWRFSLQPTAIINEKVKMLCTKIIRIKLHVHTQKVRTRERKREKQNKCAYLYIGCGMGVYLCIIVKMIGYYTCGKKEHNVLFCFFVCSHVVKVLFKR